MLEKVEAGGSSKKGTGVGFGEMAAETWRGSFRKIYELVGLSTQTKRLIWVVKAVYDTYGNPYTNVNLFDVGEF